MSRRPTYKIVVTLPPCKPTLKRAKFMVPAKMRILVKIVAQSDREYLVAEIQQLSREPPTLKELAHEIKWVLEHLEGYCTQA